MARRIESVACGSGARELMLCACAVKEVDVHERIWKSREQSLDGNEWAIVPPSWSR